MARTRAPENMSYAELTELRAEIDRMMVAKKREAQAELREKIVNLAKEQGMSLEEVLGGRKGNGRGRGPAAVKYRDPQNPGNTWTGRGRIPRWMTAAMKGGKASKEDFLI